ncbi:hypothetical protein GH733_016244 [Mirounga leonina]|nr:hypothetical protein GH733_016244 [Mirounga leonina]
MGNTTSCCVSSSPKLRRNAHSRLESYRPDTDLSREDTGCNLQHISDRENIDGPVYISGQHLVAVEEDAESEDEEEEDVKLLSISGKHFAPGSGSKVPQKKVKLAADEDDDEEDDDDFDDEEAEEKAPVKKSM